jgi:hypothetical protein
MPYKSAYTKNINILTKWAKKRRSLTVAFDTGQEDRYLPDERIIIINDSQTDEHKCYALLHELGHSINRSKGGQFRKRFNLLSEAEESGREPRSHAYRVQFIEEEIKAWRNGQKLAEQLSLKFDANTYNNYASKWVMSYVDWASDRDWQRPVHTL